MVTGVGEWQWMGVDRGGPPGSKQTHAHLLKLGSPSLPLTPEQ